MLEIFKLFYKYFVQVNNKYWNGHPFHRSIIFLSTSTFKIDDSNCKHQNDKRTNEKGVILHEKDKR